MSGVRIRAWKTGAGRPDVAAASAMAASNSPVRAKRVDDGSSTSPAWDASRGSEEECIVAPSAVSACRPRSRSQAPSVAEPSMSDTETSAAARTATIAASPAAWPGTGRIPVRSRRNADRVRERRLAIRGNVSAARRPVRNRDPGVTRA